jgi:hypothetical protein
MSAAGEDCDEDTRSKGGGNAAERVSSSAFPSEERGDNSLGWESRKREMIECICVASSLCFASSIQAYLG